MIQTMPAAKFICSFNNKAESFQLPVTPAKFEVTVQINHSTININDIGDILIMGKTGLLGIAIESFFPNQMYYFNDTYFAQKPYIYVKQINRWKDSGKPMRLAITGTNINHAFAIESFTYKEEDGTGDVLYTLQLKEYKFLTATAQPADQDTGLLDRTEERTLKSVMVYPGDDAMDVIMRAATETVDFSQYKALARRGLTPGDVIGVQNGKIHL